MKVAITEAEWFDLISQELAKPPLQQIDIATFRLGSHPSIVEFLIALTQHAKVRLLVGVGADREAANGQEATEDHCIAVAEEAIAGAAKGRLMARYATGSHTKCMIFNRGTATQHTAIVGGRNFCRTTWDDLMVAVGHSYVPPIQTLFNNLWNRGSDIRVSPFTLDVLKMRKF